MNIGENYFCSRCFCSLPEEMTCPQCGHDPDEVIASCFLEEGTLLAQGRYQIGVPIECNARFCYYGAWDHKSKVPVIIKEFFPRAVVSRDVSISNELYIHKEMLEQYAKELKQFIEKDPEDNLPNDGFIENRLIHHDVGYQIMKKEQTGIRSENDSRQK